MNWDFDGMQVVAGDFDGDGMADIMTFKSDDEQVQAWLMRGRDLAAQNCMPIPVWQSREMLNLKAVAGDFSGDFRDDLAVFAESESGTDICLFYGKDLDSGCVTPVLRGELEWDWESSQFIARDFFGDRLWDIAGFRKAADGELDGWLFAGRDLISGNSEPIKVWQDRWDANRVRYVPAAQSAPTAPGDNSLEAVLAAGGLDIIHYLRTETWFFANTLVMAHADDRELTVVEAMKRNVPVLLTGSGGLSHSVRNEIERLGVSSEVLIDGSRSVAAGVRLQLELLGLDVERVNV